MKAAAIILFVLSVCAADIIDVGVVTKEEGIAIRGCHPGDRVLVEVSPAHPDAYHVGGMFVTTNELLTLEHPCMSMVPNGTNLARLRTICAGVTSEVREVRFVIRRPVAAPRVGRGRKFDSLATPPLPSGLALALPDGEAMKRFEEMRAGKRRSQ